VCLYILVFCVRSCLFVLLFVLVCVLGVVFVCVCLCAGIFMVGVWVCVCVVGWCVCVCTVELSYLSQLVWCSFAMLCSTTYKQPTHRSTVEKEVISSLCECSRIDVGATV